MSWPLLTAAQLTGLLNGVITRTLVPQVATATGNGGAVAIAAVPGTTRIYFDIGIIGGTSTPTFPLLIEHADTEGGSYSAVDAGDLVGGLIDDIVAANDDAQIVREYTGPKPFIRAAIGTVTGSSPTLPISAWVQAGSYAGDLKPHQVEQIQEALDRIQFDIGSGDHSGAARLSTVF